jgi:hypothetical protein
MLLQLLSSVSLVAVVAFFFTFVAILIELYLISRKDKVKKEKKDVVLPDFAEGVFQPIKTSKNTPLTVKKAAIDKAPQQLSSRYVVGLIGLCVFVFLVVAISIVFKNNEQEVVETPLPSRPVVTKVPQRISPTVTEDKKLEEKDAELSLLEFDENEATNGANTQAQAPTPTTFLSAPTSTPTPLVFRAATATPQVTGAITTTLTPTKSMASLSGTLTPTKSSSPTLLKTGGDYNASLVAALISFGLIAFAFMF